MYVVTTNEYNLEKGKSKSLYIEKELWYPYVTCSVKKSVMHLWKGLSHVSLFCSWQADMGRNLSLALNFFVSRRLLVRHKSLGRFEEKRFHGFMLM